MILLDHAGSSTSDVDSSVAVHVTGCSVHTVRVGYAEDDAPSDPLPSAVTNAPTAVTDTSATLQGTVNANGVSGGSAWFEYGETIAYELGQVGNTLIGGTSNPISLSTTIPVDQSSSYHYRAVCQTDGGTAYGADVAFDSDDPNPPTVDTLQPSPLTTTSATLRATVDVFGSIGATAHFEFGTTIAYELGSFGSQSLSATSGPQSVSYDKSVTAGGSYHVRCVVTTPTALVQGDDEAFTAPTPPPPPAVVTTAATNVLETSATLNGTVLSVASAGASAYFQFGTTTAYGSTTSPVSVAQSGTPLPVSSSISTVAATTYHYRIVATDENGTSYGADMTFTTTTPPDPAPSVTTLSPDQMTTSSVRLRASVDVFSVAGAAGYFEMGLTTAYELGHFGQQNIAATTGAQTLTSTVSVTAGATYHCRFVAYHATATTQGADVTFTAPVPPPLPTAVTNQPTNVGELAATLNGTANANGVAGGSAWLEYGLTTSYGSGPVGTTAFASPSADITPTATIVTTAATTYHYRCVASTSAGTTYGADVQFTTAPHVDPAPTVVTRDPSPLTTSSATFRASIDVFGVTGVTAYFEWGATTAYENGQVGSTVLSAITGAQSFTVAVPVTPGAALHVRAVAYHSTATTYGNDVAFTVPTPPPPPVVETLAATLVDADSARLNGRVQTFSPNGANAYFEWGTSQAYEFGQTTLLPIAAGSGTTDISFDATQLTDDTTYHYRCVSYDENGLTLGGDVTFTTDDIVSLPTCATAYPDPSIPEGPGPTSIALHAWVSGGTLGELTSTVFYIRLTSDPVGSETAVPSGVTTTSTTPVDVSASYAAQQDTSYVVYAVATNVDGSANGGSLQFRTLPASGGGSPPTGDTSAPDPAFLTDTTARLVGSVNPNGSANTLARFVWGPTQGPPWAFSTPQVNIGGGTSSVPITADITGLSNDSTYFAAVDATNDNGDTFTDSTPVSFITKWTVTLVPQAPSALGPNYALLRMNLRVAGNYVPTSTGGSGPQSIGATTITFEISPNGTSWTTVDVYTQTGIAEAKTGDPSWPLFGDAINLSPSSTYQWRGTCAFTNAKIPTTPLVVTGSFTTPAAGGYGVRTQNTVGGVLQECYSDAGDPSSALIGEFVEKVFISNEIKTGGSSPYDIEVLGANSTLASSLGLAANTVRVWFESPFPKVYTSAQMGGVTPGAFAYRKARVNDKIGLDGQIAGFTIGGSTTNTNGTNVEGYWGTSGNFKTIVGVDLIGMTPVDGSIDEPRINGGITYGSTKGGATNCHVKNVRESVGDIGGHRIVLGDGNYVGLIGRYDGIIDIGVANPTKENGYGVNEVWRMNGRMCMDWRRMQIVVGDEHVIYTDPINAAVSCTEDRAFSILEDVQSIPNGTRPFCGGSKGQALQVDERTNTDPTQNAISTGPGSRGEFLLKRVTMHGFIGGPGPSVGAVADFMFYGFDGTIRMEDCVGAGGGAVRLTGDLGKGTTAYLAPNGKWYVYRAFILKGFVALPAYSQGMTKRNQGCIDVSGVYDVTLTSFDDPDDSGNLGGTAHAVSYTIDLNSDSNLGGPLQIGDNGRVTINPPGYDNTNLETYTGFNAFRKMRWGASGLQGVSTVVYNSVQIRKFYDTVTNFANP